jgi:hypothetical protein
LLSRILPTALTFRNLSTLNCFLLLLQVGNYTSGLLILSTSGNSTHGRAPQTISRLP